MYTSDIHYVARGTVIPKDIDEVNKRAVGECDGCVCDLDDTGAPSTFRVILSVAALARMLTYLLLSCEEKTVSL